MTRVFANGDHGSDGVGGLASIWNSRMAGSTWLRRYWTGPGPAPPHA